MENRKTLSIVLAVLSVLVLLGSGTMVALLLRMDDVIRVDLDDGEQAIKLEALTLRPGEQCDYTLELRSDLDSAVQLDITFTDGDPSQTLGRYARVRMEQDGEVLFDLLLNDAYATGTQALTLQPPKNGKDRVRLVFYLPETIGNEAQNAEARPELRIKARSE